MAITDPRDISGLVAWYSAEAITGLANGASITAADLDDLSGNGNHPVSVSNTPKWQSTTGPSGGPAIFCQGMHYFTLPNMMSGATAGEVMATVKSNSGSQGSFEFGSASDNTHYPYGSVVYDHFGSTTRQSFSPTVSVYSWRRYNVWSAAGDWGARLDETTQLTTGTNTVGWRTAPLFGNVWNGDGIWFGAFVVYNRKLTTTERADLAAWMAANPSGGTTTAPATTATLDLDAPVPSLSLTATYAPPAVTAALDLDAPLPALNLTAAYTPAGYEATLDLDSQVPTLTLTADYTPPAVTATLDLTAPLPALALTAYAGEPVPRSGFGFALDSTATVTVEPPLDVDAATIPLHVITPTVPVPVLVNGRPS